MTLPLITMALTPALLVMWFFQLRDKYVEPIRLIWATFFLGALCVIPSLLVEGALDGLWGRVDNPWVAGYVAAFFGVALPEELAKYAVLLFFCRRLAAFDEPMDGLVYGAAVGAGFAAVENVFYVAYGGTEVAVLRAVTAVPSHVLDGAIMGYFIGLARFVPARRARFLTQALVVPWILHGFYDWFIAVDRYLPEAPESSSWIGRPSSS